MYFQNTNPFSLHEIIPSTKRTVFISHYKGDIDEVNKFIDDNQNIFEPKALGVKDNDDFINSTDTDYVMNQIRERYIKDSTVTIVLIGSCTHSRRYVDWEIKSSLRQGRYTPNGLIGILLPSQGDRAYLPERFKLNKDSGYATYYSYPKTQEQLRMWIEDAHNARQARANLIVNHQEIIKYNTRCKVCGVTH